MRSGAGLIVASLLVLSACQTYHREPLATRPLYARLQVQASSLAGQHLPAHRIVAGQALDLSTLELLAVCNNPQLRQEAAAHDLAVAQSISAGYLPDPVYGYNHDHPQSGPDSLNAHVQSLDIDLASLLGHGLARLASVAVQRQVDLALLWQEWLLIAQVRQQVYGLRQDERIAALQEQRYHLLAALAAQEQGALQHQLLARTRWQQDAAAATATQQDWLTAQQQVRQDRQELLSALGLPPATSLPLAPLPVPNLPAHTPDLRRRPDLLALHAAWESEDLGYRQALLRQFPVLDIGVDQTTDNTGTSSLGFGLRLPLPVFNGNRPAITVAQASRRQIAALYQQRLTQGYVQVENLRQRITGAQAQERLAQTHLHHLVAGLQQGQRLLAQHRLALATYTGMAVLVTEQRIDREQRRYRREQQELSLMTLLGVVPNWEHPDHD